MLCVFSLVKQDLTGNVCSHKNVFAVDILCLYIWIWNPQPRDDLKEIFALEHHPHFSEYHHMDTEDLHPRAGAALLKTVR